MFYTLLLIFYHHICICYSQFSNIFITFMIRHSVSCDRLGNPFLLSPILSNFWTKYVDATATKINALKLRYYSSLFSCVHRVLFEMWGTLFHWNYFLTEQMSDHSWPKRHNGTEKCVHMAQSREQK